MQLNDKYFTAGELANIFNISKQTLIYYDKINLLKPEYVNEHGYRYYYINQYLDLEIILKLRSINISTKDIKQYLKNRSTENLRKLLNTRYTNCNNEIQKLLAEQSILTTLKDNLPVIDELLLEEILLQYQPARTLYILRIPEKLKDKKRVEIFATQSFNLTIANEYKYENMGWIFSAKNFFTKNKLALSQGYYSYVPLTEKQEAVNYPATLCLSMIFKGIYFYQHQDLAKKIKNFLQLNQLEPKDNIYFMPLQNHWFQNDPNNYYTQLFIPVIHK